MISAIAGLLAFTCGGNNAEYPQVVASPAPIAETVVQVANMEAQSAPDAAPSGWDNKWSAKVDFKLLATLDDSGPAAWDAAAHPDVFFTTVGPGYGGLLSENVTRPGVTIIDATTKEILAYQSYDLGAESYFEPHGLGVSPYGKYIYLPTGVSTGFGDTGTGRFLVINSRTLNLHQIIGTPTAPHHAKAYVNAEGNHRVILYIPSVASSRW